MVHGLELFLGVHDPALRSVDGDFWAVRSQKLPRSLFEEAYALIVREADCEHPNALAAGDYWGGCLGLSPEWLVFYRFYNGGRDLVGRPERALLLVAVASRSAARNYDCAAVLDQPPFSEWALRQPLVASPLHPAEGDPLTVTLPAAPSSTLFSSQSQSDVLSGETISLSDLWAIAREFPETERFLVEFRRQQGESQGRLVPLSTSGISTRWQVPTNSSVSPPALAFQKHLRPTLAETICPRRNRPILFGGFLFGLSLGFVGGWALRSALSPLIEDIPPRSCVREGGQAGQNRGFIEQPSEATIFPTTGPRNRFPAASPAEDAHDHNSARPPIQD